MQPHLYHLLQRYLENTATPSELETFFDLASNPDAKPQLAQVLENYWMTKGKEGQVYFVYRNEEEVLKGILASKRLRTAHRVHFLKTVWFRYAAAVMLLLGIGGYLLWSDRGEILTRGGNDKAEVVRMQSSNNKAILTLASGKKIKLSDKTQGQLIQADGVEVSTPPGNQYHLVLSDGTKVWLNATSSIRFPQNFAGKKRQVEVCGEVFFEVASNKSAPFFVRSKQMEVQVLGTSFNMKAYEEDEAIKTSLLEGSVKVNNKLLTPGQAWLNGKVVSTDLEQDIAWKNGGFNFNNLPLKEVMNQLARWYDVEIIYEGQFPAFNFYGEMDRNLSLAQVLNVLSGLEGMHFRLTGKKLIVSH